MLMNPTAAPDPAFASLEAALDPSWAGCAFAAMLDAHGFATRTLDCRVERVRLKRGVKALIGYRLSGIDGAGCPIDQRVMLALFPGGSAARLPDMAAGATLTQPEFGPPTAMVAALGGRAWFFPNDRKVHHIAALRHLPREIREMGRVVAHDIVHYVPEQGCTTRVTVEGGTSFYGKCRADDRGANAWAVDRAAIASPRLRLAAAVAYDPATRILWQSAVDGFALDPVDVRIRPHYWAPRVCGAITAFEALPRPAGLKQLTIDRIAQTVIARALRSAQIMPALGARLDVLAARLGETCPATTDPVLLHCDLHPGNLLWDGESFALIDLDTAAVGPRGVDLGSLVAALVHKAIEAQSSAGSIDRMVDAFRQASGAGADFDWFVAASLVAERLYRCGTRLKSPSLGTRERLLARAEQLVADHD